MIQKVLDFVSFASRVHTVQSEKGLVPRGRRHSEGGPMQFETREECGVGPGAQGLA